MQTEKTSGEFTGKHMLIIMLSFFAVILAANFTMMWFAVTSWTGLVVKNSYVASQGFNKHLERVQKQKALGWSSSFSHNKGLIIFNLKDKSGQPLSNMTVTAFAQRPAHEHEDHSLTLVSNNIGQYVNNKPLPKGAWHIRVEARHNNEVKYIQNFQLFVK